MSSEFISVYKYPLLRSFFGLSKFCCSCCNFIFCSFLLHSLACCSCHLLLLFAFFFAASIVFCLFTLLFYFFRILLVVWFCRFHFLLLLASAIYALHFLVSLPCFLYIFLAACYRCFHILLAAYFSCSCFLFFAILASCIMFCLPLDISAACRLHIFRSILFVLCHFLTWFCPLSAAALQTLCILYCYFSISFSISPISCHSYCSSLLMR